MYRNIFASLLCFSLLVSAGCKKPETASQGKTPPANSPAGAEPEAAKIDVCGLIKNNEIETIMGSPVKETKSSGHSQPGLRVSQCFYTADPFNRSVSLAVTQIDPDSQAKRSPRAYWEETFGRYKGGEEKEREGDKEKKESLRELREKGEEENAIPPKKIEGVGDDAYWLGNRVGGALYVLKKDAFIRLSIGGSDNEETKINKLKALAQKALERL